MIKNIIDTFYHISEKHKLIRSFKYGQISKRQGIGEENHPLVFLEDPIYLGDTRLRQGQVECIVNFEVLLTPQALSNFQVPQLTVEDCQNIAYHIALNFVAKIRDMYENDETSLEVKDYSFITLENYYDNNAAGVRCTMRLLIPNPINFCDLDEHFDDDKEFKVKDYLSDISTDTPEGCSASFSYKLPRINLD